MASFDREGETCGRIVRRLYEYARATDDPDGYLEKLRRASPPRRSRSAVVGGDAARLWGDARDGRPVEGSGSAGCDLYRARDRVSRRKRRPLRHGEDEEPARRRWRRAPGSLRCVAAKRPCAGGRADGWSRRRDPKDRVAEGAEGGARLRRVRGAARGGQESSGRLLVLVAALDLARLLQGEARQCRSLRRPGRPRPRPEAEYTGQGAAGTPRLRRPRGPRAARPARTGRAAARPVPGDPDRRVPGRERAAERDPHAPGAPGDLPCRGRQAVDLPVPPGRPDDLLALSGRGPPSTARGEPRAEGRSAILLAENHRSRPPCCAS